jgi:hypothetical protein
MIIMMFASTCMQGRLWAFDGALEHACVLIVFVFDLLLGYLHMCVRFKVAMHARDMCS